MSLDDGAGSLSVTTMQLRSPVWVTDIVNVTLVLVTCDTNGIVLKSDVLKEILFDNTPACAQYASYSECFVKLLIDTMYGSPFVAEDSVDEAESDMTIDEVTCLPVHVLDEASSKQPSLSLS